ncbi:MAG TPA: fibronectin type III domain-containing protein, partial [Candidatus Thermoplasmatota archaeon]|nr:fibronectin type III domain-containing protein [Candidatus Thermoplasmatota archaeon]
ATFFRDILEFSTTAPDAVDDLTATTGTSVGEISLSWTLSHDPVTRLDVYRATTGGFARVASLDGTATSYLDASATPRLTNRYFARSVDGTTEGGQSAVASAYAPYIPAAPQALAASGGPYGGQITLTWSSPSPGGPVTNHRIYRGETSGSGVVVATLGNVTTWADNGRTAGARYFYQVSAMTPVEGPRSDEVSAVAPTIASAPRDVRACAQTSISGASSVVVTWSQPEDSGGATLQWYTIYRTDVVGPEKVVTVSTSPLRHEDDDVVVGRTYFYEMTVDNGAGESARSDSAQATPTGQPWITTAECA